MNPTLASTITQSNLMRAYNLARNARVFEPKRLNRALGIVQTNSTRLLADGRIDSTVGDWQLANVKACTCEDYKRHGTNWWCKHRISAALVVKATRLQGE